MADNAKVQCALGLLAAYKKMSGGVVDETALLPHLKTAHSKAVAARGLYRYDAALGRELGLKNLDPKGLEAKGYDFFEKLNVPMHEMISFVRSADVFVGRKVVDQIESIYLDHLKKYSGKNKDAWIAEAAPRIRQIRDANIDGVDPLMRDYAQRYFDNHIAGGRLYTKQMAGHPFQRPIRNVLGNLITWNPVITTLNVFEFMPKALAYAATNGGIEKALPALIDALGKTVAGTKGGFIGRVPELEALGVYGINPPKGFKGLHNLLDVTENPLRTLSYYFADALSPGSGMDGLEKIGFVYRFGNEPQMVWHGAGQDVLALMRYTIGANKMYLSLLKGLKDPKTAASSMVALGAFSLMTAVQTGGASSIPAPVLAAFPELKEKVDELDKVAGLNLSKNMFGLDLSERVNPLQPAALGIGYNILEQDIAGAGRGALKAVEAAQDGDYALSASKLLEGAFSIGQLGTIPGVNMSSKRLIQVLSDVIEGEVEGSVGGVAEGYAKRTGILADEQ